MHLFKTTIATTLGALVFAVASGETNPISFFTLGRKLMRQVNSNYYGEQEYYPAPEMMAPDHYGYQSDYYGQEGPSFPAYDAIPPTPDDIPESPYFPNRDMPDMPDIPNPPDIPDVPNAPDTPDLPNTPPTPPIPDQPNDQQTGSGNSDPTTPDTPDNPDLGNSRIGSDIGLPVP